MESVPQARAYALWDAMRVAAMDDPEAYDEALDLAFLRAFDESLRLYREVLARHHPTPEFCVPCGEWMSRDRFLDSHCEHALSQRVVAQR